VEGGLGTLTILEAIGLGWDRGVAAVHRSCWSRLQMEGEGGEGREVAAGAVGLRCRRGSGRDAAIGWKKMS
jgi:hypothetical protein